MTKVVLPRLNQTGANEWADVESNDVAIAAVINGELSNENFSGSAGITDANLASPNNSVYRTLGSGQQHLRTTLVAGTYILGNFSATTPIASGGEITDSLGAVRAYPQFFYFAKADYEVAGKTQKLRLRAQIGVNATKPTIKFTVGLYPITVAGGGGLLTMTLGTVVSGSTVELNEPAASTISQGNSGDFTIPADGAYALGVVTSNTVTTNSSVLVSAQVQDRNV